MVITQEPAEALTALHGLFAADVLVSREQQDIALPLMIPLSMVMLDILASGGQHERLDPCPYAPLFWDNHSRADPVRIASSLRGYDFREGQRTLRRGMDRVH